MPQPPVYLFVHLFRTGGTTINGHLARHLSWDEEFVHLGPWGDRVRERDGAPSPNEWPPERWNRARVVAGHHVTADTAGFFPDRTVRFLTILRDPADQLVSRYNFRASRLDMKETFWDWYSGRARNPATRRLRQALGATGMKDLRAALDRFWFVGATECLDSDLPNVFVSMGLPSGWENRRVTGAGDDLTDVDIGRETFSIARRATIDPDLRDRLHAENPKDLRLHRYALERRTALRDRYGWA